MCLDTDTFNYGVMLFTRLTLILLSIVIFQQAQTIDKRPKTSFVAVGDLENCIHYKVVKYEKIKFLVIALKDSIEIYAWAPKPYHKFMAFKVSDIT